MDYSQFRPIGAPISKANSKLYNATQVSPSNNQTFAAQLKAAIESTNKLVVSKHAQERLMERNISISEDHWAKIEEKVSEAKKKGVTDSLVLLKNAALVVSAKNGTVITALDRQEASSKIFTNINGTIVLE